VALQGLPTLIGFATLCLAGVVGTAALWPRLGRPGLLHWVGRIALVLACQVLALLLVAVAVNDYFDFYVAWGELIGRSPTAAMPSLAQILAPGGAGHAGGNTLSPSASRIPRWPPVAGSGTVSTIHVQGPRSGISASGEVYLPPQYGDPAFARTRFPVLLELSGYPGPVTSLTHLLTSPDTVDALTRAGRMRPTVVVMLSPTVAPPRDTECADVPGGPRAETFLALDVPTWVRHTYRTDPAQRIDILGVSTGGFCAVKLAMRHPDVFGAAVAMSGYLHAITDRTTGALYAGAGDRNASDPLWRVQHLPPPPIAVLLTTSRTERVIYPEVQQFLAAARPPLRVYSLIYAEGGHNYTIWSSQLPVCLEWLSSQGASTSTTP
jgi:S-formylglutathione hydrolase FrmB